MVEEKTCLKCSGQMAGGTLKETGHFGNSPYQWAPESDAPFAVKGMPSNRRNVIAYRCERCGYMELSAP